MAVQTWGADPSLILFQFTIGDPTPNDQVVATSFVDILDPIASLYESIYLEIDNTANWLGVSGITLPYTIDAVGITENITYSIITTALTQGIYSTAVTFRIMGVMSSGQIDLLSSWDYTVNLKVNGEAEIIEPTLPRWDIEYYQGTPIPAPNTIDIDGTDWVIKCPPEFILSADAAVNITQDQDGWSTATASGSYQVAVRLADSWQTESVGTYDYYIYINPNTAIARTQPVRVRVLEVVEWAFIPDNLHFEAIKNYQEATPQLLVIDSVPVFNVVTFPDWLTITPITGQNHTELTVVPVPSINTDAGEYSGTIDISRDVDGTTITESIPVTYSLTGFIATPYIPETFAFTLDTNFIQFFSDMADTYFRVKLTAIVSEFYTGITHTKEYYYKVPLFQQHQKMNIGRIVDRIMLRMKEYNDTDLAQYKLADVSLYITEIIRSTETVVREFYLNNIKFVAGLIPQTIYNNMAFLNVNPAPSRVTPLSFYFLNYLIPTGIFSLITYRNDTEESSEIINSGEHNVFSKKIQFNNYLPGDTITLKLLSANNTEVEKKFYVFPEGKQSNHIIWEDEYKLKQALEFTGSYIINQGIVNITSKYYINLLEVLEKIDSTKTADLIINTGWLSKSDQVSITSLFSRKKAFLYFSNGTLLDLVPISNKIKSVDSDRDLISFDAKFKINFKDNAQTYSF